MIPLFLGLTAANLLLLSIVFCGGFFAIDPAGQPTATYGFHLAMGLGAGLMATMTHLTVFTYFMATTKWLRAATDKAGLDPRRFVAPAARRKNRAMAVAMTAVVATMIAMFAGAGADPTVNPWWPKEVHLVLAITAWSVNAAAALIEFRLIRGRGWLIDDALAIVNADAPTKPSSAAKAGAATPLPLRGEAG